MRRRLTLAVERVLVITGFHELVAGQCLMEIAASEAR